MKGYLKRFKVKRMLAMLLAAVMVLTICMPQSVSAATPDAVYSGGTGYQDVLTNFQYFIKGDATLNGSAHTVGAVAVGGKLTASNTIGDGAQSPSYAGHIVSASVGNGTGYAGSTRDFYYGTSTNTLGTEFTQNAGYMKVDDIFAGLVNESDALAQNKGIEITESYFNTEKWVQMIDIDFSAGQVFTIDYDVLKEAKGLNFVNFNVNDLITKEYVINIVGVEDKEVLFDGDAWLGEVGTGKVDVFVDGNKLAYLSKLGGEGASDGIQYNLSGMKLVWNFPDATGDIKWHGVGGHLMAPTADVEVTSGRFEGGIIANSIVGNGQGHYIPYNGITLKAGNIVISKTYLDTEGNKVSPLTQAKFALYTDEACTVPVPGAESVSVDSKTGLVTFDAEALNLQLATEYYAKEVSAPQSFEINDTVYVCSISTGGLVSYYEKGKDPSTAQTNSPVCENVMTTYSDTSNIGTLVVTVEDAKTREKLAGAEITLKDEHGNTVTVKDEQGNDVEVTPKVTTSTGVVTFTDLKEGEYSVSITTIPDGYKSASAQTANVTVQHTSYHTFELEKETEPIIVYLKDTEGNKVTGGYVSITDPKGVTTTEWVGNTGSVTFEEKVVGTYTVKLVQNPNGYSNVNGTTGTVIVSTTDSVDVNEHTFVLKAPSVTVTVYEKLEDGTETTNTVSGADVTLTKPNGTTVSGTTDATGKVVFTNVPNGTSTVEVTKVPTGYVLTGTEESVTVADEDVTEDLYVLKETKKGDLKVTIDAVNDGANETTGVIIKVTDSAGNVTVYGNETADDGYVVDPDVVKVNDTFTVSNLPVGNTTVEITTVPDGWKTTEDTVKKQTVVISENNEGEASFEVIQTGTLEITVKEEGSTPDVVIPNAKLEITDSEGKTHTVKTDEDGKVSITLPNGSYEVVIKDVPENYVQPDSSVVASGTIDPGEDEKQTLQVTPLGAITVTVYEKDNETNKIQGAEITLTDTSDNPVKDADGYDVVAQVTNEQGVVNFTKIPAGDYKVTISGNPDDTIWIMPATTTEDVTVEANQTAEEEFKLSRDVCELTIIVQDKENSTIKVEDTIVEVKDSKGNVVNSLQTETDSDGKIVISNLPAGETYTATIKQVPTTYELPTGADATGSTVVKINGTNEIVLEVTKASDKLGNLTVIVKDTSNNPVSGAGIELVSPSGSTTNYTSTNSDWKVGNPADDYDYVLTVGNYTTKITVPAGYRLVDTCEVSYTATVVEAETATITYVLEKAGNVKVTVTDETTGNPIPGAKVEVVVGQDSNGDDVIVSGTTGNDGSVVLKDLPTGSNTVKVTEVSEGYDVPADKTVTVEQSQTTEVPFVVESKGSITVTVTEKSTGEPITGATVALKDGNGIPVEDVNGTAITGTTDADGKIVFDKLPNGNYKVEVTSIPTGYKDPATTTQAATITDGADVQRDYKIYGLGTLVIKVVEDGSDPEELIPNTDVTVTDPEGVTYTDNTGTSGIVTFPNMITGEYTVTIGTPPSGWKVPSSALSSTSATVERGETANEKFVVAATANLTIKVVDEEDPNTPLANAQVTVTDPYGNNKTVTTDANGEATLNDWAVGESTIKINKVPSPNVIPTPDTSTVEVEKGGTTKQVEAPKVTEKGNLTITVTDELTGKKVPGAVVQVKDPSGNVSTKKTDSNGEIRLTNTLIGKYTVTITGVPDGYTKSTGTPSIVEVTTVDRTVDILIKKPPVTSDGTDDKDNTNNKDNTNSSNKSNSNSSNSNNSNNINSNEVLKRAPKTGDTGYTPIALAMMVISIVGLAGIVVYRKKTENER